MPTRRGSGLPTAPPINDLFPPATKADWVTQVANDLKNPNAYETLRWTSPEGFVVEPFYTAEDLETLPLADIQAAQKATPGWLNAPAYQLNDEKETAHQDALANGADALFLSFVSMGSGDAEPRRLGASVLSRILNGIKLSETPVFFGPTGPADQFVRDLQTVAPYQLKGGLLTPPDQTTAEATRLTLNSPQFRTVCISGHDFHQAGATATQELAFTMARFVDTYDQLTEQGLTVEQLAAKTWMSVSVGTSYFVEIAKLRAFRVLWTRTATAYGLSEVPALMLHAQTSSFYESTATPYTNLLRATTEAMSAVIGGCDVLTVRPYNALFEEPADSEQQSHADRIARNVSLLLREESYLGNVADPSAGSYYVETLTHQLVQSAWNLFLQVEEMGGLSKAGEFVKAELERSYTEKVEAIRAGKLLVGVTKFRVDEGITGSPIPASLEQIGGLPQHRLAEEFEQQDDASSN